jgi:ribosomal protein S18 acetylase RimI-like enzyme
MESIRSYQPADRAGVYAVCVQTGAAGSDARGMYSTDDVVPDVWAGPYVDLQPDLAFVLDVDGSVAGYIIATADTRAFVELYTALWVPYLVKRYGAVDPPLTDEQRVLHDGFTPDRMLIPEVDDFPAHLHINLLPEMQGKGWGRRLMDTLLRELRSRSVPGVHLGIDPENVGAAAFYERVGFTRLPSDDSMFALKIPPGHSGSTA